MDSEHDLIIIKGKEGSGKTTIAKDLVDGKKALWTRPGNFLTALKCIADDTDFLVIDEVGSEKDIKSLIPYLRKKTIAFLSATQGDRVVKMPKIIICVLGEYQAFQALDNLNILVKTASRI